MQLRGQGVSEAARTRTRAARPIAQVHEFSSENRPIRVVCISDTHGHHEALEVPDGDILIHAGDISHRTGDPFGERRDLDEFNTWLGTLPHPHKIVIGGNHDAFLERSRAVGPKYLTNATYLQDDSVEVMGLKIYGSPMTPRCGNGAFHFKGLSTPERTWKNIPDDVDILVTHGPPKGILDTDAKGVSLGDAVLFERVQAVKPKLHVFGHIHEGYGQTVSGVTTFVNAATGPAQVQTLPRPMKLHELRAARS